MVRQSWVEELLLRQRIVGRKESKMIEEKIARELATEHWDWLESLLRKVYIDAFVHGYKHAKEREDGDKEASG